MDDSSEPPLIDYDELKRDIVKAIRAVIQEEADRLGISYEASRERMLAPKRRSPNGRRSRKQASKRSPD
jgi:hypothetical protein